MIKFEINFRSSTISSFFLFVFLELCTAELILFRKLPKLQEGGATASTQIDTLRQVVFDSSGLTSQGTLYLTY